MADTLFYWVSLTQNQKEAWMFQSAWSGDKFLLFLGVAAEKKVSLCWFLISNIVKPDNMIIPT